MPRPQWRRTDAPIWFLALGFLLLVAGLAPAQTVALRVQAVSPAVAPGGVAELDVFLDNPSGTEVGGYQIAITYPVGQYELMIAPMPLADSVLTDVFTWNAPAPVGVGFQDCPLWDDGLDQEVVSVIGVMSPGSGGFTGTTGHLFRLTFANNAMAGEMAEFQVNNTEVVCLNWGGSLAVDALGNQLTTQRVNDDIVTSSTVPVTIGNCFEDPGSQDVMLQWTNGEIYDEIRVYRDFDSTPLAVLLGDDTMFEDQLPPPLPATYAVSGVVGGIESPYQYCTVNTTVVVPAVENLTCLTSAGNVELSWMLPVTYTQIDVVRNGSVVGTLPGDATSFTDSGVGTSGTVVYFVTASQGPDTSPAGSCMVDLDDTQFIRGDVNDDGTVNISDAQASLSYLFGFAPNIACVKAVDFDDDGSAVVTDPVNMLDFLFGMGTAPPPPFPNAGFDPTPDTLPCGP